MTDQPPSPPPPPDQPATAPTDPAPPLSPPATPPTRTGSGGAESWPPPSAPPAGVPMPGLPPAPQPTTIVLEQESLGRSMVRTGLKALAVVAVVGLVPLLFLFVIGSVLAAAFGGAADQSASLDVPDPTRFVDGERDGETKLVALSVAGPILGQDRGDGVGLFAVGGVTYGYTIKEQLLELAEDDDVDGVLLEMSTPGGTIFGSKAIADGVAEYQAATGKPVVAYVADISASGGMYAMAGADHIVADHGTFVGNIGVIFGPVAFYDGIIATDGGLLGGGVTTEDGITFEYLTAGEYKDLGLPYRELTSEERTVLQEGLDDAYDDFVNHVADGRGLEASTIVDDYGALIFGDEQALKRDLIDSVGPREAAYEMLAELAGAEGQDWRLDRIVGPEPGLLDLLGVDGPAESDTVVSPDFCRQATLLAIHGDPLALCGP